MKKLHLVKVEKVQLQLRRMNYAIIKRFTYLNPNVLYYLNSLMTRDAKLRQYKIDSAENFGWKYSNSDTPQTSTSYPRKAKQDGYQ